MYNRYTIFKQAKTKTTKNPYTLHTYIDINVQNCMHLFDN